MTLMVVKTKASHKKTIKRVAVEAGRTKAKKGAHPKTRVANAAAAKKPRIFGMSFASVYPLYVQKAERKGRTKAEVDEVIAWLTGFSGKSLEGAIESKLSFEAFFARAPRFNPKARLVTGVVCGVRVEEVSDPLMRKIRYLDKLVDELARGKKMTDILRQ